MTQWVAMPSPVPDSGWGVHLSSRGVPQKVYLDLALSMSELNVNYGPHVSHHIDSFVTSINRMLPPSSPGPAQVRIGWWDNLRYQIHGNLTIRTEHLSFRWMLDDVDMPHRSMLFKSDATEVGYSKGRFLLKVVGLCGSLPREGYPFLEIRQRRRTTAADRHRSGTTASAYEDARETTTHRESHLPAFEEEVRTTLSAGTSFVCRLARSKSLLIGILTTHTSSSYTGAGPKARRAPPPLPRAQVRAYLAASLIAGETTRAPRVRAPSRGGGQVASV